MQPIISRGGWIVAGVLALALAASLAGVVRGGPLDPPGPPARTMQTLAQMPPDWALQLDSTNGGGFGCGSTRFECVLSRFLCSPFCHIVYDGVLDHETGLVWQRDPSVNASSIWHDAHLPCLNLSAGGRTGFRLPTAAELMTLYDGSQGNPALSLPAGHPFLNVGSGGGIYWSSTDKPAEPGGSAFAVQFLGFFPGDPGFHTWTLKASNLYRPWCVRGAVTQ